MGRRGPKPKKGAQEPVVLEAQGEKGKPKRTPMSKFDPAAGKDVYEPEKIVAQRLAKGVKQYCVKWVGYDAKLNTWEPIEHLAGCEDMIADFLAAEKIRLEKVEAEAEAKRLKKQEEAQKKAEEAAKEAAAKRVEQLAALQEGAESPNRRSSPRLERKRAAAIDLEQESKPTKGSKRTNPFWACFDGVGAPPGKMCCKLMTAEGKIYGAASRIDGGPTGLKNHVMYKHPDEFIRLKAESVDREEYVVDPQKKVNAIPKKHRDAIHKAHARWIVKKKRPTSICEDEEYHHVWQVAMHGAYVPPSHHTVMEYILLLSNEGQERLCAINTQLRQEGMKPAIAGDIWSDQGVSLLGLCEYFMTDDWQIKEFVLAATPFNKERHTGQAIDDKTSEACVKAGLTQDVFSSVFYAVSDNASNMKSGWHSFGRAGCASHTAQLSVKVYLSHPQIKPTRDKEHGIVTHFSQSTGVDAMEPRSLASLC